MRKRFRQKTRKTIGLLVSHSRGQYQLEYIAGVECEAKQHDVNIIVFAGRCIHSPLQFEIRQNIMYDIIVADSLDGMIVSSLLFNNASPPLIDAFVNRFSCVPIVTTNFKIGNFPAICTDNKKGFTSLLEHLIVDHAYKKFAFVEGPAMNPDAAERTSVFRDVLKRYRIECNPDLIIEGDFDYNSGRRAVSILFDERGLKKEQIDVIVAANDLMAFGVIDGLVDRSIGVPQEIAVTGFDDLLDSRMSSFPLTTVRLPVFEIGRMALRRIVEPSGCYETVFVDTCLVTRNSCGCSLDDRESGDGQSRPVRFSETTEGGNKQISEFYIYQLLYTSDAFHDVPTIAELCDVLKTRLPILGIKKYLLFIFPDRDRLSQRFSLVSRLGGNGKIDYDFEEIIEDLSSDADRYSYCALPLVCNDARLGFILLEFNEKAWITYESIQLQIASTLKNMFLLNEIRTANDRLEDTNRKLEEANRMLLDADEQKTRFFINVVHETKTPLTLIKNFSEKYMRSHVPDEDLLIVKQNIDMLLFNMINFLDAKKLEMGSFTFDHDRVVDVTRIIEKKIILFQAVADQKKMKISSNCPEVVFVKVDPWAIDRILNNLLDNAVKYGRERGTIDVNLLVVGDSVILAIADDGPGIAADKINHIFEPYYQLSHEKSGMQGIGMGLFIVKKIVDSMGGEISINSTQGDGATFSVDLSHRVYRGDAAAVEEDSYVSVAPGMVQSIALSITETYSQELPSILFVDDNGAMRSFLHSSLSGKYNVFSAPGAHEAFLRLDSLPELSVIVSDVMMDDMDGHAFLDELYNNERYEHIPFIFLTAKHDASDKLAGLARGAIDYIEKPFSIDELSAKIGTIIGLRKKQGEIEAYRLKNEIEEVLFGKDHSPKNREFRSIRNICRTYKLTFREEEILMLLLRKLPQKEIASKLNIVLRTVEFHVLNIYRKLDIKDRYELYRLIDDHE